MIIGELILINSEFQVDIQDLNFLSMSMSMISIESIITNDLTSSYSWSALTSLERLSV